MGGITKFLTTEKAQNFGGNTQTITSMEVAEMVGKAHNELLKDIRRYYEQLGQGKIPQSDFFTESTYQNKRKVHLTFLDKLSSFAFNGRKID